ncbi:unnamed protein product [Adineta ricciae]|uniref:Uncharacterized protein n=1 Tax=Adineta ricciae TaxID=249248 RepID=A0A814XHQ8_ADIRI|nr:unnamed protein product [Adineta ricciae]
MFTSSLTIRHLFVGFNTKQLLIQIRYQSGVNIARASKDVDQSQSNENEQELGAFQQFDISAQTQQRLQDRNVRYLFPVQSRSYNDIISGKDCIVQARTGTGKTLAFSLPIVERLQREISRERGRFPRCLVLEPTRELAKQVTNDFLSIKSRLLSISTLYGGKEYSKQELSLQRGSDVVVGTPGRIKDFLNQKKLNLQQCEIVVLDEVDRMLDMGFQHDVDYIIRSIPRSQMIVFSATIPLWLKKSVARYMSPTNKSFINLIGDEQQKTAMNVQHLSYRLNNLSGRPATVLKLLEKYSKDIGQSQAIVFCQTKRECDQLAQSDAMRSISADVLHGDLSQRRREQVLQSFRQDIPQVDLVILTSPPQDWESYVHRSGRTGRAGRQGVAICMFSDDQSKQLKLVQQNANIHFSNISGEPSNGSEERQRRLRRQMIN